MKKLLFAFVLCLSFIIIFISCGGKNTKNGKGEFSKIRIAYMPNFAGTYVLAVAKEKGFFEEEGLDADIVKFINGPSEVAAMLSGDIHFAYIGHGAHSLAIQRKVDILIPNSLGQSEQLIAGEWSGIKNVSDLKGKTIATQMGTSGEIVLSLVLESVGINRKDLKVINMDMAGAVSAFLSKKVDAVCVWAPYTFEIKKRLGDNALIIATIKEYLDKAVFPNSWIATPNYIKNNPEIVKRFTRAILKSMDYGKENIDEAIKLVADLNGTPLDSVELEKETATWLTSKDIENAYNDSTAEEWYKSQAKIFLNSGVITEIPPISDYVRFDIVKEAIKEK